MCAGRGLSACLCFEVSGPEITEGSLAARSLPGCPARRPPRGPAGPGHLLPAPCSRRTLRPARRFPAVPLAPSADGTSIGSSTLLGIELLRLPRYTSTAAAGDHARRSAGAASRYLCVLHVALDQDDPLGSLAAAVRLDPGDEACARRRDLYAGLAGPGFQIPAATRRALSVTMITSRDHLRQLRPPPGNPRPWTAADGWLWTAASATPLQQFCPDTEDPHALDGIVYLSSSWRALALRDGVAFLGLVPDTGDNASFFAWGESYIRSLYTDVTLLAALERDALDDFANRLAHIGNRFEKSDQYRRLINEVTEFRNVFWWENVTRHGNANRILEHLHAAHGTARLFSRVIADLDAFRQQVEAQALEASVQVQAAEERRSRRFEHAASVAAIAITLPALVFTALALPVQGITSENHELPGWLVIAIGAGSMLAGAIAGAIGGRWVSRRAP